MHKAVLATLQALHSSNLKKNNTNVTGSKKLTTDNARSMTWELGKGQPTILDKSP